MSRLFGDLRQIGIVVRDIEQAMKHWVDICGVGPWFYVDRLAVTEFSYRGARHDDIHLSIALANSGDVQLELIQQRCTTPSMHAALVELADGLRRPPHARPGERLQRRPARR